MAACAALPRSLFPGGVCAFDAFVMGISILLLVSVRMGRRRFSAAGHHLSQAQDLINLFAGN